MVLARIQLRPFFASIDWLALTFGLLIGLLYGWYLRGVFSAGGVQLKASQLHVDAWVMVARAGLGLLPRWTRMRVVAIENETVSFYVQSVGMTVVAYRKGPSREELTDAQGHPLKIFQRSKL